MHDGVQPEADEDGAHLLMADAQVGGVGWGGGEKLGRRHKRETWTAQRGICEDVSVRNYVHSALL